MPLLRLEQLKYPDDEMRRLMLLVDSSGGEVGCWPFLGSIQAYGYGILSVVFDGRSRSVRAHRLMYLLSYGSLPAPPLLIRHRCEVHYVPGDKRCRVCCNPRHLEEGSAQDNARDMVLAGRSASGDRNGSRLYPERLARGDTHPARVHPERRARGERSARRAHPESYAHLRGPTYRPYARLTEDEVRNIHLWRSQGVAAQQIAEQLGVCASTVFMILAGKRWPHLHPGFGQLPLPGLDC